jgi:hypothetical protein
MKEDEPPPAVVEYFREIGKKYGALGGRATARNLTAAQRKKNALKASRAAAEALTPEERTERARKAAEARWAKAKKKGTPNKRTDT